MVTEVLVQVYVCVCALYDLTTGKHLLTTVYMLRYDFMQGMDMRHWQNSSTVQSVVLSGHQLLTNQQRAGFSKDVHLKIVNTFFVPPKKRSFSPDHVTSVTLDKVEKPGMRVTKPTSGRLFQPQVLVSEGQGFQTSSEPHDMVTQDTDSRKTRRESGEDITGFLSDKETADLPCCYRLSLFPSPLLQVPLSTSAAQAAKPETNIRSLQLQFDTVYGSLVNSLRDRLPPQSALWQVADKVAAKNDQEKKTLTQEEEHQPEPVVCSPTRENDGEADSPVCTAQPDLEPDEDMSSAKECTVAGGTKSPDQLKREEDSLNSNVETRIDQTLDGVAAELGDDRESPKDESAMECEDCSPTNSLVRPDEDDAQGMSSAENDPVSCTDVPVPCAGRRDVTSPRSPVTSGAPASPEDVVLMTEEEEEQEEEQEEEEQVEEQVEEVSSTND